MISEKLKAAREYELEQSKKIPQEERPLYHVTGAVGWINDPNGFCMYQGEYHLFFQYHPFSTHWGPMHWGHVKTKDFITWERLPVALAPDCASDETGCFSGSAIQLSDGKLLLAYTGVTTKEDENGRKQDYQQQCIAVGDGINFEKLEQNPIISTEMIPKGNSPYDFRDPKIWQEDGTFYLAVANRAKDGSGEILLYESIDYHNWQWKGVIDRCNNEYGKMWECPDCFVLDGKRILMVSPQEMLADNFNGHPGNGTVFLTGVGESWIHFERQTVQMIDYGLDFYAPQTLQAADGRRIMIAWMQNWETSNYDHVTRLYRGEMTIPRVLEIKNGTIVQNPVQEIENYYGTHVSHRDVCLRGEMALEGILGRVLDMTVTIRETTANSFGSFKIKLAKNDRMEAWIAYDARTNTVKIDRSKSGMRYDVLSQREFVITPQEKKITFRIVMDRHSVELFINGGQQAASMMIYTPLDAKDILFGTDGELWLDVEKYDLEEKLCKKNMM